MQISKILTTKKVFAMAVGLACAAAIGFSAPAQACGNGGCGYKVYKYRHYYRSYRPCSTCHYNSCNTCSTCNYCNTCNYGYRCYGCGSGYYYGGYYY